MGGNKSKQKSAESAATQSGGLVKKGTDLPSRQVGPGGFSKANFVTDNPGKITEFYEIDRKKLGEGSYGSVSKGKHKASQTIRAIKTIAKKAVKNPERLKQEIAIMKMMDHPNIIKLFESFDDHRNIYLVMEICTGGELFDCIIDAGHFSEKEAAILMQQILRAIFYMHQNRIAHRDLKPENFLFVSKVSKDPNALESNTLKIIDFGLSCQFVPGQDLKTKAGTPYYVAPEVLAGKYNELSDVWSCGVIMYVLLCGYPPFYGDTDGEVLAKVRLGNVQFPSSDWSKVSKDAKDLIQGMLKKDITKRLIAEQAVNDKWVKDKAPNSTGVTLRDATWMDNLKGFRSQHRLKKAALYIIANQLDDQKLKRLRETFLAMDANQDGQLTVEELRRGLGEAGLELPDLDSIIREMDSDGSGVIDYSEFLSATLDRKQYLQEENVWAAFRAFDLNGDGKISKEELAEVLKDETVMREFGEQMGSVDVDGDGFIDFEEFMAMMRGSGAPRAPAPAGAAAPAASPTDAEAEAA